MLRFGAGLCQSLRDHVQVELVGVIQYEMVRILSGVPYGKSKQVTTLVVQMGLALKLIGMQCTFYSGSRLLDVSAVSAEQIMHVKNISCLSGWQVYWSKLWPFAFGQKTIRLYTN